MYPAPFEYHRATSVEDAISLLGQYNDDAKILAGGHSLLPIMKLRFAQPKHVIDVRKIPGLSGIRDAGDAIVIGATTTHWMIESSVLVKKRLPILAEAAGMIGDPLVRNMGTIGGSVAHADPGADLPAVMLALGAELNVTGPNGSRTIKADDFFVSLLTTSLQPNEVLTEIRLPVPPSRTGGAYAKYPHPASRYAVVGVAALVTLSETGAVQRARVAITGLGTKATRATELEQTLTGKAPSKTVIEQAVRRAAAGIDVRADALGSVEYKENLAGVYAKRALERAVERAGRREEGGERRE